MHVRITPPALGAAALAVLLVFGLTACNPAKGEANIRVSGSVNGSGSGPKVTCTKDRTQTTRTWIGTINGKSAAVHLISRYADRYQTVALDASAGYQSSSGPNLITADEQGVWHTDVDLFSRPPFQHVTADLACP